MPKLTFHSKDGSVNLTFDAKAGDSILDIALANDVPLQHACGGFCACTTCHVSVKSGLEELTPLEDDEQERLERAASDVTPRSRLGCQARLGSSDVVVEIQNLD